MRYRAHLTILALAFSMSACDSGSDAPTSATVTAVRVLDFPERNLSGGSWDLASGPDLYFQAYRNPNDLLVTSAVRSDVSRSSLPVTLNGRFVVDDLSGGYSVHLFDRDDFDADDPIAFVNFSLAGDADDEPATKIVSFQTMRLELQLDWQ